MKVLHVLNELRASGAEVMLRQAAPLWREHEVHSHVVSTGVKRGFYAEALIEAGLEVHHLPFSKNPGYLRAFRRLVQDGDFDIVHVHPERANFWHAVIARSTKCSVVRTVHNVFEFTGVLQFKRLAQRAILRYLGIRTISVSESVERNELQRHRNPSTLVWNWIDTDKFHPRDAAGRHEARRRLKTEGYLVVATVGNCAPAKNHGALLQAIATQPGRLLFLHVGEEDPDRRERHLAVQLGIGDRCRWLGRVEDVGLVLAATDVYVMPSLYEGLGNAAVEALAMGIFCVLADVPGLRDLRNLPDDRVLWVAPTSDALEGALQVASAAHGDDPEKAQMMHEAVAARFGLEIGALAYCAVYTEMLRASR